MTSAYATSIMRQTLCHAQQKQQTNSLLNTGRKKTKTLLLLLALLTASPFAAKAQVADNVYIPAGASPLHVEITGELDCESSIGVTKTKKWSGTPDYGIDGDHVYDTDNKFPNVRTVIATDSDNNSSTHLALDAYAKNVFFDDKDIYGVWSFDYGTGATAYSKENCYFIETWRSYANASGFTDDKVSTPAGLAYLAKTVNKDGEEYLNHTIRQIADIDLEGHYWEPIGRLCNTSCPEGRIVRPFAANYDGQGHLINNAFSILPVENMGLFGVTGKRCGSGYSMVVPVEGSTIENTFVINHDFTLTTVGYLGGIVGRSGTELINRCEAAGLLTVYSNSDGSSYVGGIVGYDPIEESTSECSTNLPCELRNSFSVNQIAWNKNGYTSDLRAGGLCGLSFRSVKNCYVKTEGPSDMEDNYCALVGFGEGNNIQVFGTIENCYVVEANTDYYANNSNGGYTSFDNIYTPNSTMVEYMYEKASNSYTPTIGADQLGYMYADNLVTGGTYDGKPLFEALTSGAELLNGNAANTPESTAGVRDYDRWARPALAYYKNESGSVAIEKPINGDLPVLLMDNYKEAEGKDNQHVGQGGFRAVSNIINDKRELADDDWKYILEYRGPRRDHSTYGNNPYYNDSEIQGMLQYSMGNNSHFIYGDVLDAPTGDEVFANRISIYEHAAIMDAGVLSTFDKTHVSITFDNSSNGAGWSSAGINGLGSMPLPRDWHLLSTPLSKAPTGFNYNLADGITNTNGASGWSSGDAGTYANNWWKTPNDEFKWLNENTAPTTKRYWMDGWTTGTLPTKNVLPNLSTWNDGYFPSAVENAVTGYDIDQGCIDGADEQGKYPYGMDFYSWYEPQYHYINFKRNGPNHWHSDGLHEHLSYRPEVATNNPGGNTYGANVNETFLLSGKGYFASIAEKTLLQSSGYLNGTGGGGEESEPAVVIATKTWNDTGSEASRPASVTLRILLNGNPAGADQKITADNEWTARWPVFSIYDADDNLLDYSVVELDGSTEVNHEGMTSDGYTVTYSGNAENGFVVNNYKEETLPPTAYRVGILQEVRVALVYKTKSTDCGSKTDPTPIRFSPEDEYFSQFDSHQDHNDFVNYIPDLEVNIPVVESSSVGTSEITLNASGLWTNISFTNNEPTISDFGENSVQQVLDVMDDFTQLYGLQSSATSSQAQQAFGAVAFLRNGYLCEYEGSGSELALTGNWISSSISFDANPKYRVTTDDGKTIDLYQMKYMDGNDSLNSCTGSTNYGNTNGNLYAGKISSGGEDWDCHYTADEYESSPLHLFLVANEPPGKQATAKAEGEPKATIDGVSAGTTAKGGTRGDIEIAVTKTENDLDLMEGWNLVGNPFHAYLDFSTFYMDNSSAIANEYVVYNADGFGKTDDGALGNGFSYYVQGGSMGGSYASPYLHPHQGFFVQASENATLSFKPTQLLKRSDIGTLGNFRGIERPAYPLVNLFLTSAKGCSDVCVVELNRPEWGGGAKLRDLYSGNGLFYAHHGDVNYAAIFVPEEAERVPIKFEPKEDNGDTYTISWNTQNGEFSKLILVDNLTGVQYDMLRNSSYSFSGKKGDYWSRFYITFDVTGIEEEEEEDDDTTGTASTSFAFFDGSEWVVTNSSQGTATLDFIDLQGRVLHSATLAEGQARIGLPDVAKGMYLLRLNSNNGTKVQKIIVK
ncbi:MAG: Cna B-type domain-containing protein [Bacteroidales bacterium]|nr:Cna B-type domain-containing protein [Bacteroidales bacterium]